MPKIKCANNNCLRVVKEKGLCLKCTKLINSGTRAKKPKPIKKESSRNYSKALREAKQSFQLLRRLQETDENGIVKCVHGSYRSYKSCDGGHYLPGYKLFTCFNPLNVWPQEKYKNMDMMNPVTVMEYRDFLINKIGLQKVEWLESVAHLPVKYSTFELVEMKRQFDNEIAEIKKIKKI